MTIPRAWTFLQSSPSHGIKWMFMTTTFFVCTTFLMPSLTTLSMALWGFLWQLSESALGLYIWSLNKRTSWNSMSEKTAPKRAEATKSQTSTLPSRRSNFLFVVWPSSSNVGLRCCITSLAFGHSFRAGVSLQKKGEQKVSFWQMIGTYYLFCYFCKMIEWGNWRPIGEKGFCVLNFRVRFLYNYVLEWLKNLMGNAGWKIIIQLRVYLDF